MGHFHRDQAAAEFAATKPADNDRVGLRRSKPGASSGMLGTLLRTRSPHHGRPPSHGLCAEAASTARPFHRNRRPMREFFEGLLHHAAVAGDSPALVSANGVLSYRALVERVRGHAQWAIRLPHRVGLIFTKGTDYVICDLALSFAGKELVPLPEFFSDAQLLHIAQAAQLSDVVADGASAKRAKRLGLTVHELDAESVTNIAPAIGAGRIIFTSGTTGKPKGVCLSERQLLASVAALAEASRASAADRYLSVLPNSLLLEQIAGMYLPLSVGAAIHLPGILAASPAGQLAAAEQARATATVLVPELLAAWVKELQARGNRAPASLRFIAVGGAPIPQRLATAAWQHGLPVYEGYGLSECSSVVSVNRPDARRAGTVGRPLSDVAVAIDDRGDRGQRPHRHEWLCRRTADIGIVAYGRSRAFRCRTVSWS